MKNIFTLQSLKKAVYELLKLMGVCALFWGILRYGLRIECDIYDAVRDIFNPPNHTSDNVFLSALDRHTPVCPNNAHLIINYLIIAVVLFILSLKKKISPSWYKEWLLSPLLIILFGVLVHPEDGDYVIKDIRLIYAILLPVIIFLSLLFGIKKNWRKKCFSTAKWTLFFLLLTMGVDWYSQQTYKGTTHYRLTPDYGEPGPECMNYELVESTTEVSSDELNGYSFYDFNDISLIGKELSFKIKDELITINLADFSQKQSEEYISSLEANSIWSRKNLFDEFEYVVGRSNKYFLGRNYQTIILAVGESKSGECSYYTSFKTLKFKLSLEAENEQIIEEHKIVDSENLKEKELLLDNPLGDFPEVEKEQLFQNQVY